MALVTMKELLERAKNNHRGIGAFSVGNMEMVKGAIQAAEELDTPIILQIAEVRLKHSPLALMGPMMVQAAKEAKVDVAVHLDHGLTMETVEKALELGFTSVMFDSSTYPFEENIERTAKVVELAKKYGATVRQVISNACACCVGMVKCAGQVLTKGDKPVVAVTLMGVTNTGAVAAVEELEKMGLEVIGFHATGVGGATMEDMAANGLVDGILDLTLHELTSEYFGGGFSYGPKAKIRLVESVEKKVPLVISLGGLDFVDFSTSELPDRMDERKYMLHNANTAHIKILPEEAEALGKILAERLSKVTYPVKLLIPTKGMRHNTLEGQELYEPKSDSVLIQTIIENVNDNVEVIVIPHNLDTPEFGVKAAHYIVDEMKKQGKLPQDFGEN